MHESQIKIRVLSSLMVDMKNGKINVNHPLQRRAEQWNKKQMCRLMYCLIADKPMPTFLFSKKHDDPVMFVIDGKQRLTNIYSYINDEYALNKGYDVVNIDGVDYDVNGKYYSQLEEPVKERLMSKELITQIMIDPTDKDEREAFVDFNSTPSLVNAQLRKAGESNELMNILADLKNHSFLKKVLTKTQILKDVDNELLLQLFVLSELNPGELAPSFSNNYMNDFVVNYSNNINYEKVDIIKQALDELDNAFKFNIKVAKTSVVVMIYGMYYVLINNKPIDKYIEWLKDFLSNYRSQDKYLGYVKDATNSAKSINGRIDYFKQAIDNL